MVNKLLLMSLIGLQGCTTLKSVAYWFEHSDNMRMPEVTEHQKEVQYYEEFESSENNEKLPW